MYIDESKLDIDLQGGPDKIKVQGNGTTYSAMGAGALYRYSTAKKKQACIKFLETGKFKPILKEQMSGGKICGDIIDTQVEIAPGESNDPYDYDLPGGPGESRPVPTNEGSLWI